MGSFRVLFVDDEEELVSTLVERLGFRGVEADYALNGVSALAMMQKEPFDIVVLDLKLPGMSGVDVLKQIKKTNPSVPVLMITGHGSSSEATEVKSPEAYDYLAKPIELDDLLAKMKEALDIV